MTTALNRWEVPSSWVWTSMGAIAEVVGGSTPSTGDKSNFEGGEIAWITPADLSGYKEKYIRRGARNLTQKGLDGSGARLIPAGTVLFSSRAPIGYVAIAANPVSTNQGFKSFVLPDGVLPDYLYYYLIQARDVAVALAAGTTFLEISAVKARMIPVPVPPTPEQRRIVDEVEKHFTRLDVAVAGLRRVQANLVRYRASVLKAACEGRLVPAEAELARADGRDFEPAEQLLACVLEERRARWEEEQLARMKKQGREPKNDTWKAKYQEPIRPDTEKLGLLPEGWCFSSLDQLTHFITSGSRGWAAHYSETGQIFIRSQDINTDRLILDSVAHVSVPDSAEGRRTRVTRHDILITITGANVTKAARVVQDPGEAYVSQHVALIRPVSGDITPYAYVWIISPAHGRGRLEKAAYGAGKPGLNLDNLRELPVALPPVNEQKRIAAEVERRLSVIETLEVVVGSSLKRVERLRQAILKRAFEGKLVAQDPADEPAELLLERIKAERAAATAEGVKRGRRSRGQPGFEWPRVDGAAKGAAPAAEG